MKQKLESLLQHFDDGGNLLPGRKVNVTAAGFSLKHGIPELKHVLGFVSNGADVSIELTPVAPATVALCLHTNGEWHSGMSNQYTVRVARFIEDKPLPVSEVMAVACNDVLSKAKSFGIGPVLEMLNFYESKRTEHL